MCTKWMPERVTRSDLMVNCIRQATYPHHLPLPLESSLVIPRSRPSRVSKAYWASDCNLLSILTQGKSVITFVGDGFLSASRGLLRERLLLLLLLWLLLVGLGSPSRRVK